MANLRKTDKIIANLGENALDIDRKIFHIIIRELLNKDKALHLKGGGITRTTAFTIKRTALLASYLMK